MKHKSHIPAGKNVACVLTSKSQTKDRREPAIDVDSMFEAIHMRADYVGPVLEEILRANHACTVWNV